MNDQTDASPADRHVRTGRFIVRAYRYRNLIFKRWWVLVLGAGLAVAVEAVRVRNAPSLFVSVGQMIVSIKLNLQQGSLYSEELSNFLGTQAALMQGSEVLQRARDHVASQHPNLEPRPVSLNVNVLPKTTIFTLRASGENSEYTKAFLQACMEEYISFKKQLATRSSDTTIAGLTEQVLRLEPEMQKCEAEAQSFLSTNDIALMEQASSLGAYLSSIYQQLAMAHSEAGLLESMTLDQSLLLEQGRTLMPAGVPGGAAGNGILVNSGIAGQSAPNPIGTDYLSVKQQILLLKADRDRFAEYLKPKHPQMVALDQEIEKLGRILDIYRQQSVELLEAKKTALALQIKNFEAQTKQLGSENLVISRKAAQYNRIKAKADRVQALRDQLLATLQALDVNKELSPEGVTIYQPATDGYPDESILKKSLTMAGLLGLGLGLVILILLDRLDDRMNSFMELEEVFDEDILGQIPRERKPGKGSFIPALEANDQRHPFFEAYRNLRSSLLYMTHHNEPRPRTILLTSSIPGDGKSITATNLAITMALGGSRVLIVDADLRKGVLHERFNLQSNTGFSEVFLQGTEWRQAVQATSVPNLSLLPRGGKTQRSSEFFIGPVMDKFLKEAGQEYDYVLIDTAPVMAADDVTSLAPRVDGVIFVVRAEYTSSRVARAALNMLYQRKSHVLGIVFNSVHVNTGEYYYYHRYGDYHKT